jgi:tRNA(adenine34) deaminase
MLQSRISRLVYGARQPRLGADGSWVSLFGSEPAPADGTQQAAAALLKHPFSVVQVTRGVLEQESADLTRAFFVGRRTEAAAAQSRLSQNGVS